MPRPEPYIPAMALPISGAVPLSADAQIGLRVIETPGQSAELSLHVCLERRIREGGETAAFCPSAACFRVPLHLCALLADEIRAVATRAVERAVWAPPQEGRGGG